ncbi:hypothetical protein PR048_016098 [Dryococelus australis]|uniref:Uncharacterized protein n=1 Tax=Dryococelus australis TaxID=614101 RepID=A0ABQ9HJC6_9NEOP|nr:hypothetical protein PR048_016098 [Dryococelus australis]
MQKAFASLDQEKGAQNSSKQGQGNLHNQGQRTSLAHDDVPKQNLQLQYYQGTGVIFNAPDLQATPTISEAPDLPATEVREEVEAIVRKRLQITAERRSKLESLR